VADDGDHTYPIPNEESERLILVRKSNSSSVMWNYFGSMLISLATQSTAAICDADRVTRKVCVNAENRNILIQNNYLKSISI